MKKLIVVAVLMMFAAGCASVSTVPPQEQSVEDSRVFDSPYDVMWVSVVDVFAEHNIVIEKIEKESGLITAKYPYDFAHLNYLNCGEINVSGTYSDVLEMWGTLNVTVRKSRRNEDQSVVKVNLFGNWKFKGRDHWDDRWVEFEGKCVSTGEFEKYIFDYIDHLG